MRTEKSKSSRLWKHVPDMKRKELGLETTNRVSVILLITKLKKKKKKADRDNNHYLELCQL